MGELLKYNKLPYALVQRIEQNGYEAFFVGGCIRDIFLGLPFQDADITTNAPPEKIKEIFHDKKLLYYGLKHGTVTVIDGGKPYEITTYRTDGSYTDSRHPNSVAFCKYLEDDLKRRDFTVNALAYSPCEGLYDLFGGLSDIESKTIRCIGNAHERFAEDALRILRALRFSSVLGFTVEEQTSKAVHGQKNLLLNISGERILSELKKLLCGKNVKRIFTDYSDVFEVVLPELFELGGFRQKNSSERLVMLSRAADVCENVRGDYTLKLAALFGSFAKAESTDEKEDFSPVFAKAAQQARLALKRLHAEGCAIETVSLLIEAYEERIEADERTEKRKLRKYGFALFKKLAELQRAQALCGIDHAEYESAHFETLLKTAESIEEKSECVFPKDLKVNGFDIMENGFCGKRVGEAVEFLLGAVIDGKVENKKDELLLYLQGNFT